MEQPKEFFIRGMVCDRCVSVIKNGITNMGLPVEKISLGKITMTQPQGEAEIIKIRDFLNVHGFELISNRQTKIISQVKVLINEFFSDNGEDVRRVKFSALLAEALNMNYDSISEAFSVSEGITLEHYIINKRIERVKELLVYTDNSLTEIAHQLGFSSVNHLSRQFKELTGLTPSIFKSLRQEKRNLSERISN